MLSTCSQHLQRTMKATNIRIRSGCLESRGDGNRGATEISLDATESGRALYIKCGFKDSDECMVLVRNQGG